MDMKPIDELATATQQGRLSSPQVVKRLLDLGVESYLVDFAARQNTHHLVDGTTHKVPMILDPGPIAENFSGADLVAAIHLVQTDTVRYPDFVRRLTKAGVIGYWAFLVGKRVVYFGRKGESHVEEIPKTPK
jgi:uncharacterized protein YbcV (DUF1398 family)